MAPKDDRRIERFGRYQILTELGRGAMGVVYKALDPKINRLVAVKTISMAGQPPEEEREYRERFFREAEAAGRLSHPGIVTIFDVGEEPETRAPYIVMELVGGQSLDKVLARDDDHKLPLETALQLGLELAEALDCAQSQGVIHRDLKPANILITEDGHAKIADFGVAKLNLANHSLAGRVLGTPAYMSPEQLNGETVDGRSDLFSLGVVLYTVLTGYRPFQGNSALTVSFKVVHREPVPATVLDSDLPPGLDHIIARAIAKDPARRYQRGREMVLDIQALREGRDPPSKAGQTASDAAEGTAQTADGWAGTWAAGQRAVAAAPPLSNPPLLPGRNTGEKLLEKMWKKSFAGALLLIGLLVFGLRVGHFFWPKGVPPRDLTGTRPAASLPFAREVAPIKAAATPTAPAASAVTTVVTSPRPIVKKLPKPLHANGTRPPPEKVAGASSPTVFPTLSPAMLEIEVDHKFAEAHLSIWVDDSLTYTHTLEGTSKKHLVVFHHVQGHEFHAMEIAPGKHLLRVRVTSGGASYDQSATVTGEFASGQENVLQINFNKQGEMNLSLQ